VPATADHVKRRIGFYVNRKTAVALKVQTFMDEETTSALLESLIVQYLKHRGWTLGKNGWTREAKRSKRS
jgi:hypothetical protein